MSAYMNDREKLIAVLRVILEQLQKQGLMPALDNKEDLICGLADKLLHKIDNLHEALQENNMRKTLSLVLINEFVAKTHPSLAPKMAEEFDYDYLFDKRLKPQEMEENLVKHFTLLLIALNEIKPELKLTPPKIQQAAVNLANQCMQKVHPREDKSLAEQDLVVDNMSRLLSPLVDDLTKMLRHLFGHDPRYADSTPEITSYFEGNLSGITDVDGFNPNSKEPLDFFLDNPIGEDPTGAKQLLRDRLEALSQEPGFQESLSIASSFSPHPEA